MNIVVNDHVHSVTLIEEWRTPLTAWTTQIRKLYRSTDGLIIETSMIEGHECQGTGWQYRVLDAEEIRRNKIQV